MILLLGDDMGERELWKAILVQAADDIEGYWKLSESQRKSKASDKFDYDTAVKLFDPVRRGSMETVRYSKLVFELAGLDEERKGICEKIRKFIKNKEASVGGI
jgi:hypothetical protein